MAPSACTIDYNVLKTILTTTVPSIADEAYAVNDYDSIVATYEAFFLGVAQLSDRLNAAPLKAAAKHVFNCEAIEAIKFSTQLVGAFLFCRSKLKGYQGSGGSHGSAWHKSVKAVVDKMHKPIQMKKIVRKIRRHALRQRNFAKTLHWFQWYVGRCNSQTFTLYDTHKYNTTCTHPYLFIYIYIYT